MPTKTTLTPMEPQPPAKYDRLFYEPQWLWSPSTSGAGAEQQDLWLIPPCPHPPGSKLPDGIVITSCEPIQWKDVTEEMAEATGCDMNTWTPDPDADGSYLAGLACGFALDGITLTPTTYLWMTRSEAIGDSDE